ncbi:MAG: hypothetical protein J7J82_06305 [Staphylothermus sp.]|nr:hypothetical protein [Staphylothermus sp.]
MKVLNISPKSRWEVIFKDNDHWQAGIYVPENTSREDIKYLEKHDAPELFYLIEGRIVLVISSDLKTFHEVEMQPGKIYIVDEWHNAYRPEGVKGIALVIEKTNIKTQYNEIVS